MRYTTAISSATTSAIFCNHQTEGNYGIIYSWGRRRNATDWSYTNITAPQYIDRGFTGHEHLDDFDLINMNGRIYDPVLAVFLSPDPYVQMANSTNNLNRYSYCMNNPLAYTDPSGEYYVYLSASYSGRNGFSLRIGGGIGVYGVAYAGIDIGYSFQSENFYIGASAGVSGGYGYFGWSTNGGWEAGISFGVSINQGEGGGYTNSIGQNIKTAGKILEAIRSDDSNSVTSTVTTSDNKAPPAKTSGQTESKAQSAETSGQNGRETKIIEPLKMRSATQIDSGNDRGLVGLDTPIYLGMLSGIEVFSSAGGGDNSSISGSISVVGGMVGGMKDSYKYGNHTIKYAQRINRRIRNANVLTRSNQMNASKMVSNLKVVGRGVTVLNVAVAGYQFANSDMSGDDYARLVGAGIIMGSAAIPIVGPVISVGLGVADSYGAFNGIYNYFD